MDMIIDNEICANGQNASNLEKLTKYLHHQGNVLKLKEARLELLKKNGSQDHTRELQQLNEKIAHFSDKAMKSKVNHNEEYHNSSNDNMMESVDGSASDDSLKLKHLEQQNRGMVCSVPGCTSSLIKNPNLLWFNFPKDPDQKFKWLKQIKCLPSKIKENSVICASHFTIEDMLSLKDGILAPNTLPSLLPKKMHSKENFKKIATSAETSDSNMENELNNVGDEIANYYDFVCRYRSKLPFHLTFWKVAKKKTLTFFKIDTEFCPMITVSIKIEPSLKVHVYKREMEVDQEYLRSFLGSRCELSKWSQIKTLLNYYNENSACTLVDIDHYVKNAQMNLQHSISILSTEPDQMADLRKKLKFLSSQLTLLQNEEFTPEILEWAFSIYLKSSACYKEILESSCLTLPDENDLSNYVN